MNKKENINLKAPWSFKYDSSDEAKTIIKWFVENRGAEWLGNRAFYYGITENGQNDFQPEAFGTLYTPKEVVVALTAPELYEEIEVSDNLHRWELQRFIGFAIDGRVMTISRDSIEKAEGIVLWKYYHRIVPKEPLIRAEVNVTVDDTPYILPTHVIDQIKDLIKKYLDSIKPRSKTCM